MTFLAFWLYDFDLGVSVQGHHMNGFPMVFWTWFNSALVELSPPLEACVDTLQSTRFLDPRNPLSGFLWSFATFYDYNYICFFVIDVGPNPQLAMSLSGPRGGNFRREAMVGLMNTQP